MKSSVLRGHGEPKSEKLLMLPAHCRMANTCKSNDTWYLVLIIQNMILRTCNERSSFAGRNEKKVSRAAAWQQQQQQPLAPRPPEAQSTAQPCAHPPPLTAQPTLQFTHHMLRCQPSKVSQRYPPRVGTKTKIAATE